MIRLSVVTASVSRNAGGLFTSVRRLAQATAGLGLCETYVYGFEDKYSAEDLFAWQPLEPRVFPPGGFPFFAASSAMKREVLKAAPSILHCHGMWLYPSVIAAAAKGNLGVPYLISPRGMLDPWALRNSAWKKKLAGWLYEKRNLRSAACIHALCESEYESIRAYGLTNPVAIIPNGIDLPENGPQLAPPWADKLPGRKVMLFLGRIHPKKGLPSLIEAWARLKAENITLADGWALVIAGWSQGGHEEELKKAVSESGLGQDVLFLGPAFDEAKRACLQNADAFILPSFSEGLPMSVLEAWSYSVPVVMTAECNIPEGFGAAAAIEIHPQADSIADGLEGLLSMPDGERRRMGSNGRNLVASQFAWPQIAAQMIEVYKWVLGEGPQPDCVRLD